MCYNSPWFAEVGTCLGHLRDFPDLDEAGERCINDMASRPIVIAIEAMLA